MYVKSINTHTIGTYIYLLWWWLKGGGVTCSWRQDRQNHRNTLQSFGRAKVPYRGDSNIVHAFCLYLFNWVRFAMNSIRATYDFWTWRHKCCRRLRAIFLKVWIPVNSCFISFTTDASITSSSNQSFILHRVLAIAILLRLNEY